jgi:hypothetical protein
VTFAGAPGYPAAVRLRRTYGSARVHAVTNNQQPRCGDGRGRVRPCDTLLGRGSDFSRIVPSTAVESRESQTGWASRHSQQLDVQVWRAAIERFGDSLSPLTCRADLLLAAQLGRPLDSMEIIVQANGEPHRAAIEFATAGDLGFVERWREALGATPTLLQRDAADFAQLARERYRADSTVGQPYISARGDIGKNVAEDPTGEVGGLALLKCDWFPGSHVIGLCHFRRSWCNNIVLDYLAIHPLTFIDDPKYKVKGIGTALLCFLSRIAVENVCGQIWGEATHTSCGFYRKLFELESVNDLFVIPPDSFKVCAQLKLDWQDKRDSNAANMALVQEVYDTEEAHPPLAGNRTLMAGSKRQLVHHFLELPRHTQDEIAESLGLRQVGDADILEDEWCRILFGRASRDNKLKNLWDEVEKRHQNGEPEKNPFVS